MHWLKAWSLYTGREPLKGCFGVWDIVAGWEHVVIPSASHIAIPCKHCPIITESIKNVHDIYGNLIPVLLLRPQKDGIVSPGYSVGLVIDGSDICLHHRCIWLLGSRIALAALSSAGGSGRGCQIEIAQERPGDTGFAPLQIPCVLDGPIDNWAGQGR